MGITQISLDRINRHIQPNSKILILGCQNLYDVDHYMQVAEPYFEGLGHDVISIDILGCQGSYVADLREDLSNSIWWGQFDLILQHGTIEHIDGSIYMAFKNIHEACKVGGIMIHENPKTGNWPKHGYHYFSQSFFMILADNLRYKLLEVTEEASMSNYVDGWNVSAVLQKINDEPFMDEATFKTIYDAFIFSE